MCAARTLLQVPLQLSWSILHRHISSPMLRTAGLVLTAAGSIACRSPRPIYAESEGLRVSATPPIVRPARRTDSDLLATKHGQLVIRAGAGTPDALGPFTVDVADAHGALVGSQVVHKGRASFVLAPGEYTVTARSVGFVPQRLGIALSAGYADTIQFILGQR